MKLAINGGVPVRKTLLPNQNTIGSDEKKAVLRVMNSGCLTGYQGNWSDAFYGGPEIRALEEEWAEKFGAKYAIACNSCTSGLFIALKAVGTEAGMVDDVIVTPWSMTCSASLPMAFEARPVFADIEKDFYCLDPKQVHEEIVRYSSVRAILIVDLFGQPYDQNAINRIAKKNGVFVIEDAAQALGARHGKKFAGTLGDIGVFSLNQGKHITCGEGGMIVTDSFELSMKCRLIMNHGEAVAHSWTMKEKPKDARLLRLMDGWARTATGFNLRMTEIQAAIARVQLRKLDEFVERRLENVVRLCNGLRGIPAISLPKVRPKTMHTFYCVPFRWDKDKADGLHRDRFIAAVKAELKPCAGRKHEGVPISCGYTTPIHRMPFYASRYDVSLPVVERCAAETVFIIHRLIGQGADRKSIDDVIAAFHKVYELRKEVP
jgi:dTDP-4-amino-4,6-dideoxygalactose transaminase